MYVWMMISHDKYELPLMVADTARELAAMSGSTENNIYSCVSKNEKGVLKWTRFIRVKITD